MRGTGGEGASGARLGARECSVPLLPHLFSARHEGRRGALVLSELDAYTYLRYGLLAEADAESPDALLFVAARKALRLDGIAVDFLGATIGQWLTETEPGRRIAQAAMPVYLEASVATAEDLLHVEDAALAMLIAQHRKNPWDISTHADECERDIWEEEGALLPKTEVLKRGCSACLHAYSEWSAILKTTGHVKWGRAAERAFELIRALKTFPGLRKHLSARDYQFIETVRATVRKRKGELDLKALQRAEDGGK